MTKTMSGKVPGTKLRSRPRYGTSKGLAFWTAAMLGQLYQWRPGLKQTQEGPREPGQFDVKAAFDAVNKR